MHGFNKDLKALVPGAGGSSRSASPLRTRTSAASPSASPALPPVPSAAEPAQLRLVVLFFFNLVDKPPATTSGAGRQAFCLQAKMGLLQVGRVLGSGFKLQSLFLVCSSSGAEALHQRSEGLGTLLVAGTRPPECVPLEMWDPGASAANRAPLASLLLAVAEQPQLPLHVQNDDFKILLVKV